MSPLSCAFGCAEHAVYGCPRHWPAAGEGAEFTLLVRIIENQEKIMADLTNLQAADAALTAEVTTAITDWTTALQNANGDQAAVDAVRADMQAAVAKLQAADPATPAPAPSGDGTTPPSA